jgi:uncharacterized protein involved in propanediol utilization
MSEEKNATKKFLLEIKKIVGAREKVEENHKQQMSLLDQRFAQAIEVGNINELKKLQLESDRAVQNFGDYQLLCEMLNKLEELEKRGVFDNVEFWQWLSEIKEEKNESY